MLKPLLRDAAVYGASTVVTRAVALLIVPIYTRLLAPSQYGAIDILSIFGNLITLTVALEIGQAVARFIPDADSEASQARIVSTATGFALVAYTIFVAVALTFAGPLGRWLVGEGVPTAAIVSAIVSIWAVGLFQLLQNVLRFLMRPWAFTVASLLFSLVGLAVGAILVIALNAGVSGVFIGQVAGGMAGSASAFITLRKLYRPVFSWDILARMLAFSAPLVPASLGVFVTLYIDRIALNQLTTLAAVGVFGIGYRLASIISLVLIGFQMALTPLIYQRYEEASTRLELARIFRLFVAFALVVSLSLSIWAPEILRIATVPAYYGAAVVVPLLTPAILLSNMYVFMPGLAIAKQTRAVATITISGGVLNTALNFALIPILGVAGAALATLISSIAVFAAYVLASQRTYPVPHQWRAIVFGVAAYAVLVAAGVWIEPGSALAMLLKPALMAALVWLVVLTGLVDPVEIRSAVRWFRRSAVQAP